MNRSEKAKEVFHKAVDEVKEGKQLDQKLVLQETKKQLLQLHEDVSYASVVLQELKKTNRVDQKKFQTLDAKLRGAEKQQAIAEIAGVIDEITGSYDTLQGDQKEKVKTMTEAIAQSKNSLSGLKSEVMEAKTVDYAALEEKLINNIDEKFSGHWYSFLAKPYKKHVHEKVQELKEGKQDEDKNTWEKITSSIADWFYGLVGSMVLGKSVSDMIGDQMSVYKEKTENVAHTFDAAVKQGKEKVITFSPEELKDKEKNLRSYVAVLAQKYGKTLDASALDRVMKRMNVKKLASDNTPEVQKLFSSQREDANVATSMFETMSLPFYFGYEMLSALVAEDVIDAGDIAYHTAGGVLEYGLKGFKLFGSGMKVACGKISLQDIGGELKHVYDKSPEAAQSLIWAIMYRTQHSPLFKFAANTAELMAKAALRPILEAKDDLKSLHHISDGFHGHMSTAVAEMEEFCKYLPDGDSQRIKDLVKLFKTEVETFREVNNINLLLKETASHGRININQLKVTYSSRFGGDSHFLNGIKEAELPHGIVATELQLKTANIGEKLFIELKKADLEQRAQQGYSKIKSFVKMRPNELSVMLQGAENLKTANIHYANVVNHRGHFKGLKESLAGMKGGILNMKQSLEGKTYFNFHTAQDFEEFMQKAKHIGKQSPETLKFMLGKMPLFLVGGMALGKDGAMSEKMKQLTKDLWSLFPIIGPGVILWDGMTAGKLMSGDPETWGQMGLGAVLIGMDGVKIFRYGAMHERGKLGRYIFQPITDLAEVASFATHATKNSIVLTKDFINVAKTHTAAEIGKSAWTFFKSEGRLGRAGIVAGLIAGGYFTYDYFISSNDLDQQTKDDIAKYKDTPDQLDSDIAKQRPMMKQDERNDFIRAALLRQGGFSPEKIGDLDVEFDAKKNTYTALLPSVISRDQVVALNNSLEDALSRVQPESRIDMRFGRAARHYFTKQLHQQYADMKDGQKEAKMDEYVRAMGYENPAIALDKENT